MNPSGGQQGNMPLCGSCHQYTCAEQQMMCSGCLMKATETLYSMPTGSAPMPQSAAGSQPSNTASSSTSQPQTGGHIPGFPTHYGPAPPGASANANFFPFFSSLEGVSEQDFNNAVFSEAGNLNFLGQNFASAVPPNFGNINNSSSPNLGSMDNDSSQQPSDSNRFSSPPYEEEDDLNGIWVGDRTSADNVFYYGCFPGSLLGSTNKETQDVCEKLASLLQETHIEDDLAAPTSELNISTAAKRHLLDLYFRYHYPFFPVLHKPTIMTQFNQGKLPMLLLNVIFAVAYFYTNEESYNFFPQLKDKTNEEVAQEFEAQAKKCLDECFSEAEIYTIQALLLMTLYHHRTTVSNNVWLYSGMATRMAMELGLHKDCENLLNGAFEPIEQEIRKKTWWGCFVLDTMYSTMLGRPLSIQQELCDVKLPALADDEDDPNEIPCTQVFIAMSKLGQIVGKLNRLLTSVKLKSNLQDRGTRAHDCLVSLKNWFKMLPPSLKKISESPPENISEIKNCFAESYLTPLLHSFYHTAIIVGQVLVHTDGLFRVTNTNLMVDSLNSATEIVRIMTRFDAFYAIHGLSFKFYPLYVSAFLFLHKIKVSATPTPPPQGQNQSQDSSSAGDQWNSLFLSCLTTLNKFAQNSENGRYSMTVLTGMAEHQKVKLPEAFKRIHAQSLISTQNPAHASSMGNAFFSAAMANPQAVFGMVGNNIDAQALAEMAALGQNSQFNMDLNSAISSLGNPQFSNPQMFNTAAQSSSTTYPSFAPEQFTMGLFRPEDLMNLPNGLTGQYVDTMMNNQTNQDQAAAGAHIEEINVPSSNASQNSGSARPQDNQFQANTGSHSASHPNPQHPPRQTAQTSNQGGHQNPPAPQHSGHSGHQNVQPGHQVPHPPQQAPHPAPQQYNQQGYLPQQNYSQPAYPQTYGPPPPDMYNSNLGYQQNYSNQNYGHPPPVQQQPQMPPQNYGQQVPGSNYSQMYNHNYAQPDHSGNPNMNYQQQGQYGYQPQPPHQHQQQHPQQHHPQQHPQQQHPHPQQQQANPNYQQQGYTGHVPQYPGQHHQQPPQ